MCVCVRVCACACVCDYTHYDMRTDCCIAEHLKWYFEDLHLSRVTTKIDIGEGSDVRLLKKVYKCCLSFL